MAFEMKQGLKQSQQLLMSPQIQQALKILMLSRQELETLVQEELRENPVLEELDPNREGNLEPAENMELSSHGESEGITQIEATVSREIEKTDDFRGIDELFERFSDSLTPREEQARTTSEERDLPGYEIFDVKHTTLHEEIEEQLQFMHLTPYELECALLLTDYLDSNGRLELSLEEICAEHDVSLEDLEYALLMLQRCEPIGIGARSVQECLLLQVKAQQQVAPFVEKIIQNYWNELQKQDYAKIAKSLKVSLDAIKKAVTYIRTNLDPRPARQFGEDSNQSITPDVFIFKRDGKWIVSLNEDGLPRLQISERYQGLIKEMTDASQKKEDTGKLKSFLNDKIKSARWVVKALSERNRTILRVTEMLLAKQQDFFEHGIEHLKPMTLKDISDELGLHESTISRTTNNKFLHSPRGIFELKYFFNAGMSSGGKSGPANETVKTWVGEFIRAETAETVLSDQDLAEKIEREKGVKVARRTVAKYREALGFLPSSQRAKSFR